MFESARGRKQTRTVLLGTLVLLATYAGLAFFHLSVLYRSSVDETKSVATSFAQTVERVLNSDLRGIAVALDAFASDVADVADLSSDAILSSLERMEAVNPAIVKTSLIAADGTAVNLDKRSPAGRKDFGDREYFRHHRADNSQNIYIDGPFSGRLIDRQYLTLSRRVDGADGQFRGVVVAAIDLESYSAGLYQLETGPIDVIGVFRDDGLLLLRVPDPFKLAGTSFSGYPLFAEHLKKADAGFYLAPEQSDGATRYVAYSRVAGFPLIVGVTVSTSTALSEWWSAMVFQALQALAVVVGVGGLMWAILSAINRRVESEHGLAETSTELASVRTRHRSMLDALPANIALLDADGTIVDLNSDWRAFGERNNFSDRNEGRGANYLSVCEAAAARGSDDAARVANGLRAILGGDPRRFEMDYPCHSRDEQRWSHLMLAPIDLGDRRGAVAMHFDVTARKLTEIALSEERHRLRRLTEEVPGVVFEATLDGDGTVRWRSLSERSRDLFGISPRDAREGGDVLANVLPPDELNAVSAAFQAHLREGRDLDCEFRVRRPDGETRFVRAVAVSGDDDGRRRSDGIFLDVTAERKAVASLAFISTHDILTGLLNRTAFLRRLDGVIEAPPDDAGTIAVYVVGVDDFGDIGDAYGMEIGDAVLSATAQRLVKVAGAGSVVARISGERFAVLQSPSDPRAPAALAEAILAHFREPLDVPGQSLSFSVSIGIARPEARTDTAAVLITGAERALRRARRSGRGTYRFDEMHSGLETQTRLALKAGLARALANGEFVIHYQPRVRLSDGVVTGCEALLRWQHPVFGMQSPAKFIPVAEQSGQIVEIGRWVLHEACRQAKQWLETGNPDLRIAVNISAVQVTQSDIVATVETILAETGLPASALELEMTEAVAFDQSLRGQLDRVHDLGVSIAIDDFGTGFSSLGTLRSFPLDILKIDQSFVRKAPEIAADRVVVGTIVELARGLKLLTVAEGVETIEQAVMLHALGCDEIQGYYIAMPMEAADFGWFLETGKERARRKLQPLYSDAPQLVEGG